MSPKFPIGLPLMRAPCDWLQSSMTRISRAWASLVTPKASAARPSEWTSMTARVFGVMRATNCSGPILKVPGSLSATRGTRLIEDDRRQRAGIGHRRHDHFAAGRQIERRHRDVKRRRAGRDRVGVTPAHEFDEGVGVSLLENTGVARIDLLFLIMRDNAVNLARSRPRRAQSAAASAACGPARRRRWREPACCGRP